MKFSQNLECTILISLMTWPVFCGPFTYILHISNFNSEYLLIINSTKLSFDITLLVHTETLQFTYINEWICVSHNKEIVYSSCLIDIFLTLLFALENFKALSLPRITFYSFELTVIIPSLTHFTIQVLSKGNLMNFQSL